MPELPEVHALVSDLRGRLVGRRIERCELLSFSALKTFDPPLATLNGTTITAVSRYGKFLAIEAGNPFLVIHLARAGWIRWREGEPVRAKPGVGPLAARLVLEDGSGFDITEAGTKKSLAIHLVRSVSDVPGIARLGPDPLGSGFTVEQFRAILSTQGRAQLKGVLRDQSVIGGIGNAYSDEILHRARMSPFKPATLTADESADLFAAMQSTLREAVDRADGLAATQLKAEKKSHLAVHGRCGQPCPVCGDSVRQVIYSDSAFQYCPTCQTGGKPLSDRVLSRLLK